MSVSYQVPDVLALIPLRFCVFFSVEDRKRLLESLMEEWFTEDISRWSCGTLCITIHVVLILWFGEKQFFSPFNCSLPHLGAPDIFLTLMRWRWDVLRSSSALVCGKIIPLVCNLWTAHQPSRDLGSLGDPLTGSGMFIEPGAASSAGFLNGRCLREFPYLPIGAKLDQS